MKPIEGWDLINEAGEFKQLPKGIYGMVITNVIDNPEKEAFEVYCDVAKGEYKDYFKTLVANGLKDTSRTFRSYKANALPFFKAFITAVVKSNPGYNWDWDEKKLIGKNVIGVVGEEEYEDKDGNVRVATRIEEFRSLEAWKEGKIKVPELKKLPPKEPSVTEPVSSANLEAIEIDPNDLPF